MRDHENGVLRVRHHDRAHDGQRARKRGDARLAAFRSEGEGVGLPGRVFVGVPCRYFGTAQAFPTPMIDLT